MEKFLDMTIEYVTKAGINLLLAILLLVVGIKLSNWAIKLLQKGKGFSKLDVSLQSFLKSFLKIVLYILVIITAAVVLGIPTTSFITMLASAGVAIGLAIQGALSNFAGGLMILFFKPFHVGDYIEAEGGQGTVTDITVFYTFITTNDSKVITLPNGTLTNSSVINYTRTGKRRVDLTFSVSYSSDTETVKRLLVKVAEDDPLVFDDPAPNARMVKQNSSSLDFTLFAWCKSEDYWSVLYNLNENVKAALDSENIVIPFPQIDVHLDK
ncbi:MAG: mechanosensitive ion channel family protein [Firmicutes bacterium]|nr:mechanosensitive ion channel family protein [Bacillota bacterium]